MPMLESLQPDPPSDRPSRGHPIVSALVVTYNHGSYVREAVLSVLAQTVPVHEIVVVDDGSTDDTCMEVERIDDPRVRLLRMPHRGIERLAETYNEGLAQCRGDLVAVLEGDDQWPATKIATQLPAFDDATVVVSHGPYAVIGARGTKLRERVAPLPEPPAGVHRALGHQLLVSYIMPVTAVIRASALRACGGFRQLAGTPHWDHPTFLALAELGTFSYTCDVVGIWRKHGASGTTVLAGRDLAGVDLSLPLVLAIRERRRADGDLPSPGEIRRSWSDAFGRQAWQVGRLLLLDRKYREARELALRGLRRADSASLRLRLSGIIVAALVRTDLERWSRYFGTPSSLDELS